MEDDWNGSAHVKIFNWTREKKTIMARKYNILESKYESFSVIEMAKRTKEWVGCKVTNYRDEKHNYEHFFHLIKHGRLESIIENDSKKHYEESDPETSEAAGAPTNSASASQTEKTKDHLEGTYYKTLELISTANNAEIKKQFRRLALKYHPDKNLENQEEMRPKFEAITDAQKILLDHEIRLEYDRCLCLVIENKSTVADLRRKKMYKTLKAKFAKKHKTISDVEELKVEPEFRLLDEKTRGLILDSIIS
ncbi:dnaJ domain-containing protein [Ditylenchus destructor]|uniref:DnaJ domain-containing protein n=1 Tax=Ditylenchus destructor TaxID=166010 RepID=A0AAD4QVJ8_9BILA|nr:dnaJ domain-containing protein [Ditylenchus destructor]